MQKPVIHSDPDRMKELRTECISGEGGKFQILGNMNTGKPAFIKERRGLEGYLNMRNSVFTVHWNTLPREAVEFNSLGVFKNSQDMILSNVLLDDSA